MKQNCHVSSAYSARSATGKRAGQGAKGGGGGAVHPQLGILKAD